eukprot:TRINITY_DN61_c0_g1_i3.p1 TRINITY_DN61_c0_g1~~TRINITY_DN61_c0_g1_i3.p1  ORF type:complete len:172 (-),score=35.76 TRINITY_DN61_c0_g1_i3:90-605(-)
MLLSQPKKRTISELYSEENYDQKDIESAFLLLMLSEKFKKEEESVRPRKKKRFNEVVSQSDSEEESENGQVKPAKKKRHRTTPEQLRILESTFLREKTPDINLRKKLAAQLDMTPRRVQVWFQNKRAKEKRESKKRENDSNYISPITNIYGSMGYGNAYQHIIFPTMSYTQ